MLRRLLIRSGGSLARVNCQLGKLWLESNGRISQTRFISVSHRFVPQCPPSSARYLSGRSYKKKSDSDDGDSFDLQNINITRDLLEDKDVHDALSMFNAQSQITPEEKEKLLEKYDPDLIEAMQYFADPDDMSLDMFNPGLDDNATQNNDDNDEDDPVLSKKHFLTIKNAAEAGVDEALFELANCYMKGLGTPINMEDSVRYFKRAADSNLGRGQAAWGLLCLSGEHVPVDHAQAVKYLQLASDQGVAQGTSALAQCYLEGLGVEKDLARAYKLHEQAAAEGVVGSQYSLGYMLGNGIGVEQDDTKALAQFELAADGGSEEAHYTAGMMLLLGRGAEQTQETESRAFMHLQSAANKEHPLALCAAGLMLLSQEDRTTQMVLKGFQQVRKAADLGLAKAQYCVGMMLLGIVSEAAVPVNHKEGVRYTKKAADQGHPSALLYFEHINKHQKK